MNGFFKAVWYISLNPFVSKLPSGSYKYSSLTSSALMLKLGKLCADAPMRNKRKGYQPKSSLSRSIAFLGFCRTATVGSGRRGE